MLYEYVLENGVWKLYWGGKAMHVVAPVQKAEDKPRVLAPRAEVARRDEPVLVIQA